MQSLSKEDAIFAADKVTNYFSNFNRIDDYFRHRKVERLKSIPTSLFGGPEDDLFSDYSMNPEDMEFRICEKPNAYFDDHLEIIASFSPDDSPVKTSKLVIQEVNTGKDVEDLTFDQIRITLINSKPRNDWLGSVPDLPIWNKRVIMGFIIVPTHKVWF